MSAGDELFAGHRPSRVPEPVVDGTAGSRDEAAAADVPVDDASSTPPSVPVEDAPPPAGTVDHAEESAPDAPDLAASVPEESAPDGAASAPEESASDVAASVPEESASELAASAPEESAPAPESPSPRPPLDTDPDATQAIPPVGAEPASRDRPNSPVAVERPEPIFDTPSWVRGADPDATQQLTLGSRPAGPPAPDGTPAGAPDGHPTDDTDARVAATQVRAERNLDVVHRNGMPDRGPTDPDATAVIALDPTTRAGRGRRSHDESDELWDTQTIRRWDASMTDERTGPATSAMHRPSPLHDREDVDVDRDDQGASRWYEIPLMILTALTLAFLLRTFVIQVFYIPSGSMIPTLEINDRIAVEKLSYIGREPDRGEVVVFAGDDPLAGIEDTSTTDRVVTGVGQFLGVVPVDAKDFVKRVIGLPGDTVVLTDGVVTVNGVELDEPYALLDTDNGEWSVPDGMLFVMGDNRANSGDSRSTLGFVPVDDVVGRAVLTIWPFDRAGPIPGVAHDEAVDAGS